MGDASMVRDRVGGRASSVATSTALGERLLAYLRDHPDGAELTAKRIAVAHGISERYVYVVLGRMGVSLGGWIRERRLLMAAATLADADAADVTISAIAYRWGFADHPHFCREFKRRFGMSPSEWRRRHRQRDLAA
jgi:AraC-like DNA-binding protein